MQITKETMRLYAVTDRSWLKGEPLHGQVERALQGGATLVQLREKNLDTESFLSEARQIQSLCKKYQVPLIINDDAKIAAEVDADGVHVGQGDLEVSKVREIIGDGKIIGVTAKTPEQAARAQKQGADYLGAGAVFPSPTKAEAIGISLGMLKEICHAVTIPVVAIGGITPQNMMQLKGTGIAGIAVISAVFAQEDITAAAKELRRIVEEMI